MVYLIWMKGILLLYGRYWWVILVGFKPARESYWKAVHKTLYPMTYLHYNNIYWSYQMSALEVYFCFCIHCGDMYNGVPTISDWIVSSLWFNLIANPKSPIGLIRPIILKTNFELIVTDEDIGQFQISMNDLMFQHLLVALYNIENNLRCL